MSTSRLTEIRRRFANSPSNLQAEYFGEVCTLKAVQQNTMSETPALEEIAKLNSNDFDTIEFFRNARDDIAYLLDALGRGIARVRELEGKSVEPKDKPKNYASECAIKCKDPAFKKFLKEQHSLGTATDDATADKVRELLGISSRKILNDNTEKAKLWRDLVTQFERWMRDG